MVLKEESVPGWPVRHFALSNPSGPGQGDVPGLLRALADKLEKLPDIELLDIVFKSNPTDTEDDLSVTVYFVEPKERNPSVSRGPASHEDGMDTESVQHATGR